MNLAEWSRWRMFWGVTTKWAKPFKWVGAEEQIRRLQLLSFVGEVNELKEPPATWAAKLNREGGRLLQAAEAVTEAEAEDAVEAARAAVEAAAEAANADGLTPEEKTATAAKVKE